MSNADVSSLVKQAAQAAESAYAPYSSYRVGAALLADDGTVVTGCNVENASYGLTICAERVAVTRAVAAGHQRFRALAIVATGEQVPYPCGACRQVLAEFCAPDLPVYMTRGLTDVPICRTLGDLLPEAFSLSPGS